jgi:hypothetical protein
MSFDRRFSMMDKKEKRDDMKVFLAAQTTVAEQIVTPVRSRRP